MSQRVSVGKLNIEKQLHDLVQSEVLPGTGIENEAFWGSLADLLDTFGSRNKAALEHRALLQTKLNEWHKANPDGVTDSDAYQSFLKEIGYLVEEGQSFNISVDNVDSEVATVAGPQLVVPVNNARYAINAANARWGSLYDALYGTDAISEADGAERAGSYNAVRGGRVVAWASDFLDQAAPLASGSHADASGYAIKNGKLSIALTNGSEVGLKDESRFRGFNGSSDAPDAVLLCNNGMHMEIQIDRDLLVYRNWLGLMKGDLSAELSKGGKTVTRTLNPDREYQAADGTKLTLAGRSLMLVRNVGSHMYTDAVLDSDGNEIVETYLDAMVTLKKSLCQLKCLPL